MIENLTKLLKLPKPNPPYRAQERAYLANKELKKLYPVAHCELIHQNPYQLLVATILSAQCTDARVNMVTPALFEKYPSPEQMAKADITELEQLIMSTGFYHNKAKAIKSCCQVLVEKFNGVVPNTMEELLQLPGVGRKTANVILSVAFRKPGLAVDTHVTRLSNRLGLTSSSNPLQIEADVCSILPDSEWGDFGLRLILHGRRVCHAKNPECTRCTLNYFCPYYLITGDKR